MAKNNIKIPKSVKEFGELTLKGYKKEYAYDYDSKSELKDAFRLYLLELLPDTVEFMVKYGHINRDGIPELKEKVFARIIDRKFIKLIRKELKNDNEIKNIQLLPILLKEILFEAKKANDAALSKDPNAEIFDMSDVIELLQDYILKKKMKKLTKEGMPESLAFDILTIVPCKDVFEFSQFYRIHSVYDCLYDHAKRGTLSTIKFAKIMEILVNTKVIPGNCIPHFIIFALLERKEKFSKITDEQKPLYVDITTWCFNMMEHELSKDEVKEIINAYVTSRKRDDIAGKDSNRRYVLSSLSAVDYERISKIVNNFIVKDDSLKKYL